MDSGHLLLFLGASLLLILAPGPDILFLITQSLAHGRRAGLATALGLAAGNLGHTLGAALGVSVIFRTSELAFQGLQIAGVGYLLYLAWKALATRHGGGATGVQPVPAAALFGRGLAMNLLNPKVALFFLAFLPQFAVPAAGSVWPQMLLLGLLFTLAVVLVFGSIALFAAHGAHWLGAGRGPMARWTPWLTAGVFLGLALRLALVDG
jgi:threonine/homoserine/homoserine lactone efflux protein